jgi:methyltransferase (TIGR00027 family)
VRDEPSKTAEAVCAARATDQRKDPKDRIVDDPWAKLFLGPVWRAGIATLEVSGRLGDRAVELSPGLVTYVLARHRFIDDALARALAETNEPFAQVVLLGAGYDTRAYRFAKELGVRRVFEVDFPSTSRRKAEIVAEKKSELPGIDVTVVEIDFAKQSIEERLLAHGFQRGAKTFFVWEGVSMYLTRKAVQGTLAMIRGISGAKSEIAMDFWYLLDAPDLISTAHRMSANLLYFLGEPMTFGIHPEDVGPFVSRLGLELAELADAAELERRYVSDERRVYPACYVALLRC